MPHLSRRSVAPRAKDLAEAAMLLTRWSVPVRLGEPRGAVAAWAWPVVGGAVGLLAAGVAAVALGLGLGAGPAAALALAAQALSTGALHEDGLADCTDGFWGGATRARRLEIMADSRVGSYGVLALLLLTLLRWSALAALLAAGWVWGPLVAAGALGRWPMALVLAILPPARPGGLGAATGRVGGATLGLAGASALAVGFVATGAATLVAASAVAIIGWGWTRLARAKIGGQTGDVCGGAQQLGEAAALLALVAALT